GARPRGFRRLPGAGGTRDEQRGCSDQRAPARHGPIVLARGPQGSGRRAQGVLETPPPAMGSREFSDDSASIAPRDKPRAFPAIACHRARMRPPPFGLTFASLVALPACLAASPPAGCKRDDAPAPAHRTAPPPAVKRTIDKTPLPPLAADR